MPAANSSNNVNWRMLSILLTIATLALGAVATMSNKADARIEKSVKDSVEKLDREKVDKDLYIQHLEVQKEYRTEQKEQWKVIDKKLDKALGL